MKNKWKRSYEKRKGIDFIISNDMNDVVTIIKSLEDSDVSINGATETVKHKIKKQKGQFLQVLLALLAALSVQPVVSSLVKGISERGVRREGRPYMDKIFQLPCIL